MRLESRSEQLARLGKAFTDGVADVLDQELELAERRGAQDALSSKYLHISEACALLHCCRKTIYNHFNSGRLTYVVSPGGLRLIERSQLTRAVDRDRLPVSA